MRNFLAVLLILSFFNSQVFSDEKKVECERMDYEASDLIPLYLNEGEKDESQEFILLENLNVGSLIFFGFSKDEIYAIGAYVGEDQFICIHFEKGFIDFHTNKFSDPEWRDYSLFTYRAESKKPTYCETVLESTHIKNFPSFLYREFNCYYLNEQKLPLVISPKCSSCSLNSFKLWAKKHHKKLKTQLAKNGALLLRDFPVESAEDFASVIKEVVGRDLIDYLGGEGSRKRIISGVYTSTEAPPQFHIPLHHELSCTNHAPDYICFYCEIAPQSGSGQTILGLTESITNKIMEEHPRVWNLFEGKILKYISRHPPEGSFFAKVNKTHKTWQDSFATNDKEEAERICLEKGFEFKWLGDWIEVIRLAPAIQNADEHFDHPYWFNQAHLYHSNPRIRGGFLNHTLANLLYISPSTRQYDIEFEDGTQIPQEIIYEIYDVLEEETIKFDWQKGDILIIDNKKALHGRAPYEGPRRILASMLN